MITPAGRLLALAAVLATASACTVNPRKDFDQVQKRVYQQTGQRIRWNAGTADDAQVRQSVAESLKHELSADQAVAVALLNNPDLQATYEDLGIAQSDLVQAGLLANPVISAEIRFPRRPYFPVEANLEEQFLQMFLLPLREKVAEASYEEAKATVTAAVIRRAAETRAAFYKLQGAMQLADLRQSVVAAAEANLDASHRQRDAGNIRDLDLANDEASTAEAKLESIQTQAEVAEDREDLNLLMGVGSEEATWSIGPRLPELVAENQSVEGLVALARMQRADLAARQEPTLAAVRTAGFANYAAVLTGAMFGVHFQRDAEVKSTIGPSVTVPIPIFDQGQAAMARAEAQFHQADDRYRGLEMQVQSQVRKADLRMETARMRALYFKDSVIPLRHRIVEQTQLQYNGMFVGVSVLLQAKQEEIHAGLGYVEALRDYWVARSELEAAAGGRLPENAAGTERGESAGSVPDSEKSRLK